MSSVSVVVRTYNEQKYLGQLLDGIARQDVAGIDVEVVVVDSGSSDETLEIARQHGARIVHINKDDFTFGRSLNVGCEAANGDFLVVVSGHCIPESKGWIAGLIAPLISGEASYSYGRQLGWSSSRFSEHQIFAKYYPDVDKLQDGDFFCNNANSALPKSVWREFRFDESLTGLEDMELGLRLVRSSRKIAYVASAAVYHVHEESWPRIRLRYEREAIALQSIMPQVHVGLIDFLRYYFSAVLFDFSVALQQRRLTRMAYEIVRFRFCQFWGTYRGNQEHRKVSSKMKERYFYPK